jgi:Raf kinase inhibitor-like YbhB/YbcL family protein
MRFIISIILGFFTILAANAAEFTLTSKAFPNNGTIPPLYTCDGKNISPDLSWSNAPSNTKSFVLLLSSPDWSVANIYLWILYKIPANINSLEAKASKELPAGIGTGINYYYVSEYRGPCPPDHRIHHYVFTLYALDNMPDLSDGAELEEVLDEMDKHIIKQTSMTGTYIH